MQSQGAALIGKSWFYGIVANVLHRSDTDRSRCAKLLTYNENSLTADMSQLFKVVPSWLLVLQNEYRGGSSDPPRFIYGEAEALHDLSFRPSAQNKKHRQLWSGRCS